MLKLTVAVLALAPLALQAQAIRPAQPQNAMVAAVSAPAASVVVAPVRVTTGVIAPVLVKTVDVDSSLLKSYFAVDKFVTVDLTVTADGVPAEAKVVKSASPEIDQYALTALQQYRFRPAMLDGAPVPVAMVLTMRVPAHVPVN